MPFIAESQVEIVPNRFYHIWKRFFWDKMNWDINSVLYWLTQSFMTFFLTEQHVYLHILKWLSSYLKFPSSCLGKQAVKRNWFRLSSVTTCWQKIKDKKKITIVICCIKFFIFLEREITENCGWLNVIKLTVQLLIAIALSGVQFGVSVGV